MLKMINTVLLIPNPNNKRRSLSDIEDAENALYQTIDGLAQNISEVGLINALTVTPFGNDFLIIAGERRYKACKSLGWQEIPCNVMEATEEEQMWIMLSENLQRKDLSEVEKADEINEVVSETPDGIRGIARKLGVDHGYIVRLLQLHKLPTPIKEMVKSEEITAYQARPLSQLGTKESPVTPELQVKVAEYIRDNHLNYDGAKETVQRVNSLPVSVREALDGPGMSVEDVLVTEVCEDDAEEPAVVNHWKTFLSIGQQLYDILERDNVKSNINAFNKIVMKKYLLSLKERINGLLDEIDYI
jgi:ParB/RepB/Spo0J family partition protein